MQRDVLAEYRALGIRPISGGSGDGDGANDDGGKNDGGTDNSNANPGGNDGGTTKIEFTAEQQAEINRIVAREKRDAIARAKADADRAAADKAEADRQQREQDEQVKRGEFDKARTALETARDQAKTEADRLKAENDAFREAMATGVAAGWQELPEAVRKVGEKQHAEDDVLGRWRFLHDPDTRELVKALTPADTNGRRGNGPDPRPTGAGKPNDDEAKRGAARIISGAF